MSLEQRQHQRRDISLQVKYRTTGEFVDDYTANISIGGCFVKSDQDFTLGQQFPMSLFLPNGLEIKTNATVRWVSPSTEFPGVGVQFEVLSKSDRSLIAELVTTENEL